MSDDEASIEVHGLAELRKAFRDFGQEVEGKSATSRLTRAYRSVSEWLAADSQGRALGGTAMSERMAAGIRPGASPKGPTINVRNLPNAPAALAVVFGKTGRAGWFAAPRFAQYDGRDQGFLPWVGSSWQAGKRGEGPYFVNEAIAENQPRIYDDLSEALDTAARDVGLI